MVIVGLVDGRRGQLDDDVGDVKSDDADDDASDDNSPLTTSRSHHTSAAIPRHVRATESNSSRSQPEKPPVYIHHDDEYDDEVKTLSDSEEVSLNEAAMVRRPSSRARHDEETALNESVVTRRPNSGRTSQRHRDGMTAHHQVPNTWPEYHYRPNMYA